MEHGPEARLVLLIALGLIGWGLLSRWLLKHDVSAPIVFVALGAILSSEPVALVHDQLGSVNLRVLAEITLALLLFSDAARVDLRKLRHSPGVPLRLLLLGLPLSIAFGTGLAVLLFPGISPWAAAATGAAVAPTDAALGAQVVEDHRVPGPVRRILGVESGLNDGIAAPFVTYFVARAAGAASHAGSELGSGLGAMGLAVAIGVLVGAGGAGLLTLARRYGWAAAGYQEITVLALALCAYSGSLQLGGNGFIAAFVGGLAFGAVLPERAQPAALDFDAQAGSLLSLVVWFIFGTVVTAALAGTGWPTVVFAILALTVGRMVPVTLALIGSHTGRASTLFIGWFGPRGLASVIFGLIAFDSLTGPTGQVVISAIALTVLFSVLAHGVSAEPLIGRYAASGAASRIG